MTILRNISGLSLFVHTTILRFITDILLSAYMTFFGVYRTYNCLLTWPFFRYIGHSIVCLHDHSSEYIGVITVFLHGHSSGKSSIVLSAYMTIPEYIGVITVRLHDHSSGYVGHITVRLMTSLRNISGFHCPLTWPFFGVYRTYHCPLKWPVFRLYRVLTVRLQDHSSGYIGHITVHLMTSLRNISGFHCPLTWPFFEVYRTYHSPVTWPFFVVNQTYHCLLTWPFFGVYRTYHCP